MRGILYLALLLLVQLVLSQPTQPEYITLQSSSDCKKKVTSSSRVHLFYESKFFESDNIYESATVELKPGNKDDFAFGFLDGIQGMCSGEVRRLIIPAHLHTFKAGQNIETNKKAMIYKIEVLDISHPLLTRTFWAGIAFIAIVYVFVSKKAKEVDTKREDTYKKKMQDKSS
ncbi:hypothetical protein K501DRAFT_332872 [Backusella circina FSU 941]|nr:hypothetical protein K501DRAFT_332872 [Backusella circina FSU 941]